ncbi:MAG TPA: hypothetical protein VHG10_00730 [Glycomyces sp.]|nr:hypothetical protein [Glycomyces sp.]
MSDLVFSRWGMTMRTPDGPVDLVPLLRRLEGDKKTPVVADEREAAVLALTHLGVATHQIHLVLNMSHPDVKSVLAKHGMKPVMPSEPEPFSWMSVAYTSNTERRNKRRAERVGVGGRLVHQGEKTPHGTDTGYTEYGCQCVPCENAHAAKLAAYRARKARAA